MRSFVFTTLLLLVSTTAYGADVYFCSCSSGADADCIDGDDADPGTLGSPRQTFEAARTTFSTLQPGDGIRLCRGGSWAPLGATRWTNGTCEANNPCLITDYSPGWGSGDEGRPQIHRNDGMSGFDLGDAGNADHEEGYLFSNLELYGGNIDSGEGFRITNDADDITIDNVLIQHFRIGVHVGGSQPCSSDPECDGKSSRIILRNSDILENSSQGWLGGSSGSQILDSYFESNGTTPAFDHNIYISGSNDGLTEGIRVAGNTLYRSTLNVDGDCSGVALVVHGLHNNMVIENNWIQEDLGFATPGCWGIAVDTGYSIGEIFSNLIVRNNYVINVGNVGIGVTSCVDCLIENNVVIHQQDHSQRSIAAPNRQRGDNDTPLDAITVRNNSIFSSSPSGGVAIQVDTEGTNHLIASNAMLLVGTNAQLDCLRTNLPTSSYDAIDHNLCLAPNSPNAEWSDQMGDLAAWQVATGFDTNSAAVDPGFAAPALLDLSAASDSSAMVDSGHPTESSPQEIGGASRDANPDTGAHEFGINAIFLDGFESGNLSRWTLSP